MKLLSSLFFTELHPKFNEWCTSACLWSFLSVSFPRLLLTLTVWRTSASTSTFCKGHSCKCTQTQSQAHMPRWTSKPCDRHVHLSKNCPDRRKTSAINSPLWTCPSLSLWISGAELIFPLPAGPLWTGLSQSSSSYRCQESQLTACCCSWFQFVGHAMD